MTLTNNHILCARLSFPEPLFVSARVYMRVYMRDVILRMSVNEFTLVFSGSRLDIVSNLTSSHIIFF